MATKLCVLLRKHDVSENRKEKKIVMDNWERSTAQCVLFQRKNAKRKALEIWKCHTPHSQHSPKADTCGPSLILWLFLPSTLTAAPLTGTNNKNIEMRSHTMCTDAARINLLKIKLMWTKSNKTNHTLRLCPIIIIIIMANQKRTLSRIPSRNHSHRHTT